MPPIMEASDFTIRRKDFPALPGNLSTSDSSSESIWSDDSSSDESTAGHQSDTPRNNDTSTSREIVFIDGGVLNIPSSMIDDQFGIMGLLTIIRAAEANPGLRSLTLGEDLSNLGLNLESSENLYSTFRIPWRAITDHNVSYVPYTLTPDVRQRLADVFISKYEDDLLFYLFYSSPRDALQLVAAAELYKRGWRFHTTQRQWICSLPGGAKLNEMNKFIQSYLYFFDVVSWKKVVKECFLDCGLIEGQPVVPEWLSNFQ